MRPIGSTIPGYHLIMLEGLLQKISLLRSSLLQRRRHEHLQFKQPSQTTPPPPRLEQTPTMIANYYKTDESVTQHFLQHICAYNDQLALPLLVAGQGNIHDMHNYTSMTAIVNWTRSTPGSTTLPSSRMPVHQNNTCI